ncbi:MAG TPA: hypothetical protein VJ772_08945 [Nitrososphaeraceae archaeon]|nr:hypothetical protein [Nitrososphaeraceae archaeon]
MPLKQKQVVMFLFAALLSALLTIIFPSTQQVSAADCEGSSCDSLVNIDGINIGKIDDDKILNTEDINKILGDDNTVVEKIQTTDNGADSASNNNNNKDVVDKIRIKDLNVLIDDDDNKPKVKVLPDNVTVIEIKDFKILIPSK